MPPMILQGRRARRARRASSERRTDNLLVPLYPGALGLLRRPLLHTLPGVGNSNDGGVDAGESQVSVVGKCIQLTPVI